MKAPLEQKAWRAVRDAGVPLPEELTELWDRLEQLEAERDEINAETTEQAEALSSIVGGSGIAAATDAAMVAEANAERLELRKRNAGKAVRYMDEAIKRWIGLHRGQLVTEHLRPVVDDMVAKAGKLAGDLERFAPIFDPTAIAADATPAELKAWRASRELQERFTICLQAFVSSWNAATGQTAAGSGMPGHLCFDAPGGIHVWERPQDVADVDVRDGRDLEVLHIAVHAEAGYRLAGGQEVLDLTQRYQMTYPWIMGELNQRRVLIPTGEPVAPPAYTPPARRTGRASFS